MAGERRIDGHVDTTAAASSAAADLCKKKLHSARRRRQELMRIRSSSEGSDTKRIRNSSSSDDDDSETGSEPIENPSMSLSVSYGHVSVVGRRREMEDAVTVAPALAGAGGYDFFGVYDGHGGAQVAACCRERMHLVLADVVAAAGGGGGWPEEGRWRAVMGECFGRVDGEAGATGEDRTVGSTAVVALVGAASIVVANCGDSRAVLSRGGVAVPLSQDHKPDRPDEMERVEAAGGKVINWGGYRVVGVLATSRSIGDYYLKPYVTSEPEVTVTNRSEKDEFLILASDGLWDVISNEMACKITRQCLNGRAAKMFPHALKGSTASEAAAFLAELAISRGSRDNISVVVVELRKIR